MADHTIEKEPFLDNDYRNEENGSLDGQAEHTTRQWQISPSRRNERCWFILCAVILSCVSGLIGALAKGQWWEEHLDSACLDRVSRQCKKVEVPCIASRDTDIKKRR